MHTHMCSFILRGDKNTYYTVYSFSFFNQRMSYTVSSTKYSVKSGTQAPSGARKIYSSGGPKKVSGYHLGKAGDALSSSSSPNEAAPYKGQKYLDIKNQCLRDGTLFEDPEFPAIESSLFFSGKKPPKPFVWKRPKVVNPVPGSNNSQENIWAN